MLKPNRVLDFRPILSLLPAGGGVEDTEPQPLWDFSQFCPLSPWEWGGGEGGKPQAYIQVSRFRKKSSERSSERLPRQEAAHSENERSKFRQHGTLKPFQKGKYDEIQSNPFIVYCRSLGACRL